MGGFHSVPKRIQGRADSMKCLDCESEITATFTPYGVGVMAKYDCPKCGVSYDTNIDATEQELAELLAGGFHS